MCSSGGCGDGGGYWCFGSFWISDDASCPDPGELKVRSRRSRRSKSLSPKSTSFKTSDGDHVQLTKPPHSKTTSCPITLPSYKLVDDHTVNAMTEMSTMPDLSTFTTEQSEQIEESKRNKRSKKSAYSISPKMIEERKANRSDDGTETRK